MLNTTITRIGSVFLNLFHRNDLLIQKYFSFSTTFGQPKMFFKTLDDNKVVLHKKSILSCDRFFSSPLLAYYVKMKTNLDMVHDATICSPYPIILFSDEFAISKSMMRHSIIVDKKVIFTCDKITSSVIQHIREQLHQYIEFRLTNPATMRSDGEEQFLKWV